MKAVFIIVLMTLLANAICLMAFRHPMNLGENVMGIIVFYIFVKSIYWMP